MGKGIVNLGDGKISFIVSSDVLHVLKEVGLG